MSAEQNNNTDNMSSVPSERVETPVMLGDYESMEEISSTESRSSSSSYGRLLSLLAAPVTDDKGQPLAVFMGILTIVVCGTIVGLLLPKNPVLPATWYRSVSAAMGYTYFLAWSVSFYPQVLTNYRRKTTEGLSVDFVALNALGFACYSIYNVSMYFSPDIEKLYKERYGEEAEITVQPNDVLFAVHALLITLVILCQVGYYDGVRSMRPSRTIASVILGILGVCLGYPFVVVYDIGRGNWLDCIYLLSFVKIIVTLIKYVPQVILNYRRKSTEGWSIWQILLDLTGGILSDLQLVLDSAALHDFSGVTGNLAKLMLGFVSISFDVSWVYMCVVKS